MNHHLFRGVGFSLLFHGVVLCSIVYVGIILPDITPPLVIDFSIENDSGNVQSPKSSPTLAKPVQKKANPGSPVKKVPPVSKPKPVERKITDAKPQKPEPIKPAMKKPVPPKKPKKIVQVQTKIKRPVVKQKVMTTAVKPILEPVPEVIPAEMPNELVEEIKETFVKSSAKTIAAIVPPTATGAQTRSPSPKERYIKANFSYIRDTVDRNTSYPSIARRMGWEGKVLVTFIICADGRVEDIRVIKSCGFDALDKNAIKTIKRCAPFPKPPLRAEVTLPITYRLN